MDTGTEEAQNRYMACERETPTKPLRHWAARPSGWLALSVIVLCLDFLLGPNLQFPILSVIPVCLAAWHGGLKWGVGLGVLLPLSRIAWYDVANPPWPIDVTVLNSMIRGVTLVVMAFFTNVAAERTREVKQLRGLLSYCRYCKRIQRSDGAWEPMVKYVKEHTEVELPDMVCPECAHKHFPTLFPSTDTEQKDSSKQPDSR